MQPDLKELRDYAWQSVPQNCRDISSGSWYGEMGQHVYLIVLLANRQSFQRFTIISR